MKPPSRLTCARSVKPQAALCADSLLAMPKRAAVQIRCNLPVRFSGSKPKVRGTDTSSEICPREKFRIADLEVLINSDAVEQIISVWCPQLLKYYENAHHSCSRALIRVHSLSRIVDRPQIVGMAEERKRPVCFDRLGVQSIC